MTAIVQTWELSRLFGSFVAVDKVSFAVEKGEIFGFLGANGAGKTTTIRMLCGLLRPSSGRGVVGAFDINTQAEKVKQIIGYMSQKFSLYEELKVDENLSFFGGVYGLRGRLLQQRKRAVLELVGLSGLEQSIIRSLPLGYKQRLALACAIIHQPQVVFLDEPTGGVDPVARRRFWDLIYDMAREGTTIFVTTHYMDEAEYCHRVSIMHKGAIIALGSPGELKKQYQQPNMEELFIHLVQPSTQEEVHWS